jgi:O-antigen ligase
MKSAKFFRYNILADIVAILLFCTLLVLACYDRRNDVLISCLRYFYVFFLLHFVYLFLQIFRYKQIKVWKKILYCIVLLATSGLVFFVAFYYEFWLGLTSEKLPL